MRGKVHFTSVMSTTAGPKVVLSVDDHPLIRSALREMLSAMSAGMEMLEAPEPESALALLRQRQDVDLIFLDLHFAQHNGLDFIGDIRSTAPAAPLVVYTVFEDLATLRQALACGASGIVPKTHSMELLQAAIELVMQGGIYLPPELARQFARTDATPLTAPVAISEQQRKILGLLGKGAVAGGDYAPPQAAHESRRDIELTGRQADVLRLIVRGLANKEIAKQLQIAEGTVKQHARAAYAALGVSSRTQAILAVTRRGIRLD
jgi:DNA-binding NarL/FixJ family response regulator